MIKMRGTSFRNFKPEYESKISRALWKATEAYLVRPGAKIKRRHNPRPYLAMYFSGATLGDIVKGVSLSIKVTETSSIVTVMSGDTEYSIGILDHHEAELYSYLFEGWLNDTFVLKHNPETVKKSCYSFAPFCKEFIKNFYPTAHSFRQLRAYALVNDYNFNKGDVAGLLKIKSGEWWFPQDDMKKISTRVLEAHKGIRITKDML